MSRIALNGNALGTGTFTVASPNSNTDQTLTLPNATGTINTSGSANEVPAGSAAAPSIYPTGDTNTGIFFPAADTVAIATGGTERMRADSSGNVGVGTSSPAYKLDVNGSINSQTGFVYLGNANVYANYRSGNNDVIYSGASGFFYYQNITSTYHAWYTGNTERARIDSSGNLLVGTTSTTPNPGAYISPIGAISQGNSAGGSGFEFLSFRRSGVQIGTVTQNGTTAVAYNTTSDYRLKENVAPMTGALARVAALKPVTYTWKSAPDENGEGFIAHELAEVCPQAVTGEKDAVNEDGSIKAQSIDTSFLVATLTAAIQEQQAIIESLTARIAALETK